MKAVLPLALAISSASVLANNPKNTNDDATLEQVVVYGSKQDKSLSSLTTSVQVLGEEALETQAIQDFNDVFARVANVASLRDGNETVFSVRGISIYGVGDNLRAFTSSVYVDDVPLNNSAIRYGGFDIWDVEQVEVFRGPQGTLQGRNSLAGAIYVKTQDPTYETNGKIRLQAAEYGTTRFSVAGGAGLIDDVLAVRFAIDDYRTDGFIENVTRNEDDYAGSERSSYRAKILFEPTDTLSALLTLSHIKNDINSEPTSINEDPFSRKAYSNDDDFNNLKADVISLKLEYELNDELMLTSITSQSKDEVHRFDDWDSTAEDRGVIDQVNKGKTTTQELRLNFDNDGFNGVAGLYISEQIQNVSWQIDSLFDKSAVEQTAFGALAANGITGPTAQFIWDQIPNFIDVIGTNRGDTKINNYALFGELNFNLNDYTILTLGLRYDSETQDYEQFVDNKVTSVIPPTGDALVDGAISSLLGRLSNKQANLKDTTYNAFLPKASIQWLIGDDANISFTVQKGYRAGGLSVSTLTGDIRSYEPESTWNTEIAFRNTSDDGKTQFNLNVFSTDWIDQQVDVSPTGDPRDRLTANVGRSALYGAEIEIDSQLTDALQLFGSIGYVRTEFKEFKPIDNLVVQDNSGNEFSDAPNFTGNLGILFDQGQGIYAQADATAQNKVYTNNENTRQNDSRVLINGRVGYKLNSIDVSLWVKNLMDREYLSREFQTNSPLQDYARAGAPRTVGISLGYEF